MMASHFLGFITIGLMSSAAYADSTIVTKLSAGIVCHEEGTVALSGSLGVMGFTFLRPDGKQMTMTGVQQLNMSYVMDGLGNLVLIQENNQLRVGRVKIEICQDEGPRYRSAEIDVDSTISIKAASDVSSCRFDPGHYVGLGQTPWYRLQQYPVELTDGQMSVRFANKSRLPFSTRKMCKAFQP